MDVNEISRLVNRRLKREPIDEVIHNNTMNDGDGNFITTIVYRVEPVFVRQGFSQPQWLEETRYMLFVNGQMQGGGKLATGWKDTQTEINDGPDAG